MIFCVQSVMPASFTVPQLPVSVETHQHPGFPTSAPLHCINCVPQLWDPRKDLLSITRTFRYLDTSGWYWGAVSAGEARAVLQDTPEGTFLVRDSSHPLYMLTLSVKTGRGPTNVRIEYSHGQFRLDSSALARPRLQTFPDVPSLVQHYVRSNRAEEVDGPAQESTPTPAPPTPTPMENALLLKLIRPLHRRPACPSLQHLARLAINRLTPCPQQLPLPRPLLDYLHQYPFQV